MKTEFQMWLNAFIRLPMATGVALASLVAFAQPHWPQFRGPNGQGISAEANPPITFGPASNVLWTVAVPPGHSSPCVWGDRIYLTAHAGTNLITLAIDRTHGRELWRQTIAVEQLEKHHATSSPVTASPAADGERVYSYFGSFGLTAYGADGKEVWRLPMPKPKNHYGTAGSPILHKTALMLVVDTDGGDSHVLAVERATGKKLWKQARPDFPAGWSTAAIWSHEGAEELIVLGAQRLMAYDPRNGKPLWWVLGFPQETIAIPVFGEGMLFASAAALGGRGNEKLDTAGMWRDLVKMDRNNDGKIQVDEISGDYRLVLRPDLPKEHPGYAFPGPAKGMLSGADTDKDGTLSEKELTDFSTQFETFTSPVLMAIRPGGQDDATKQHVAWQMRRGIPEIPSPLCYQGSLYLVRDGGLVTCLASKDGQIRFQERLGIGGQYCAAPIAAAGRIYIASQSGTISVLRTNDTKLEILAENALGEPVLATPALAGTTLIVRTEGHLYAFGGR